MTGDEAHWLKIAWWSASLALVNTAFTAAILAMDSSAPDTPLALALGAITSAALLSTLWCSTWATLPLACGWPARRCRRAALMSCCGFGATALCLCGAWLSATLASML